MKQIFIICMILIVNVTSYAEDEIKGPTVQQVQRAALDYARIRPEDLSQMKHKSRVAAALPKFEVNGRKTFNDVMNVTVNDNVSVTSSGVNIGPTTTNMQQNLNNQTAIEVKAVWALNELIYNRDMLAITEEARYQVHERRQILADINKLYFEWLKLKDERESLRSKEVIANLDAMTGGWFSDQLH